MPSTVDRDLLLEARTTTSAVARTFSLACRLLPQPIRDDVYLLYLVFRTLDDQVDGAVPGAEATVAAVEQWAREGDVGSREAAVLAQLANRWPLPRQALLDFCAGMRDDLERRAFTTEEELDVYCYRVAGTVGVVMLAVLGAREDGAEEHAAALGMAMQRTNILRDIDEDGDGGRVYLAEESLVRFGSPAPGAREALLRDQIRRADALYDHGIAGIPRLRHGRRAIAAAAIMYREILRQIERDGYGREPGRAVVSGRRKLALVTRSAVRRPVSTSRS